MIDALGSGQKKRKANFLDDLLDFSVLFDYCRTRTADRCSATDSDPIYQAVWADTADFKQVLISPVMVQDHMPDNVLRALEKVSSSRTLASRIVTPPFVARRLQLLLLLLFFRPVSTSNVDFLRS